MDKSTLPSELRQILESKLQKMTEVMVNGDPATVASSNADDALLTDV